MSKEGNNPFKELVDSIRFYGGAKKTLEEMAGELGYDPSYFIDTVNKGGNKKILDKVKLTYKDILTDLERAATGVLNEPVVLYGNKRQKVKDPVAKILESLYRIEARQSTNQNFIAKIFSKVYGQPLKEVLDEMQQQESEAAEGLRDLLK